MSTTKWLQKQEHFDWMQKCLTCGQMCEEFMIWSIKNGKYVTGQEGGDAGNDYVLKRFSWNSHYTPYFDFASQLKSAISIFGRAIYILLNKVAVRLYDLMVNLCVNC